MELNLLMFLILFQDAKKGFMEKIMNFIIKNILVSKQHY
jgi:hypothetical protein